jgi:hypothetical protein
MSIHKYNISYPQPIGYYTLLCEGSDFRNICAE